MENSSAFQGYPTIFQFLRTCQGHDAFSRTTQGPCKPWRSYKPYSKSLTTPLYVNSKSNHPPCIIKNIPEAATKRLSEISSDEEAFNEAPPPYQEALREEWLFIHP